MYPFKIGIMALLKLIHKKRYKKIADQIITREKYWWLWRNQLILNVTFIKKIHFTRWIYSTSLIIEYDFRNRFIVIMIMIVCRWCRANFQNIHIDVLSAEKLLITCTNTRKLVNIRQSQYSTKTVLIYLKNKIAIKDRFQKKIVQRPA